MRIIIYPILFLFALSCDTTPDVHQFDKVKVSKEVRQMLNAYHQDVSEGGLLAEFDYLDNSSDFFWVPPGFAHALSYDSVRSILEQNAKTISSVHFHWDTLQIYPLSESIANFTGVVEGRMVDTAGTKTKMTIIESGTAVKRKGGWKLLSGQSAMLE